MKKLTIKITICIILMVILIGMALKASDIISSNILALLAIVVGIIANPNPNQMI